MNPPFLGHCISNPATPVTGTHRVIQCLLYCWSYMWDFIQIQLDSDWAVSILENKCSIGFQRVHWGGDSWFVWWWWWVPIGSSEYQRQPVGASGFQRVLMCTNLSQWVPVGASGFSGYQCNHGLLDLLGLLVVLPPWTAVPHWPLSTISMASRCWEI